jgi:HEAT repeat protein
MNIDDAHVAALIADLDHPDKPKIRAAVDALIALAADSVQLRDLLERRLGEADHRNYWPVAYVLGHLPNPSAASILGLLEALDHREPDIRWAISLLLARIAKDNVELVVSLIRLCASGTDNQKRMALYCLRDLALSDAATAAAMIGAIRDPEPTVRVAAAICLKSRADLDTLGKEILLDVYLNDAELKVRHAVAIALATLGNPTAEFVAALQKNSRIDNEQIRKAALAALELLEKRRPASSGGASSR